MNDVDLPLRLSIGGNNPPEPIEAVEDKRVAALIEAATKWAQQVPAIESEEAATAATDWLNQLDATWDEFEGKRKAEKKPLDDAVKAVQARWLPRLERIDICRRAIRPLHRAWLKLKDARLRSEREAAELEAAEAQRRADQLAEQATAGGLGTVTNMIAAAEATQEAERARQAVAAVPLRAQVRGSLGGRTHSLRTVWRAAIIEQDLVYRQFCDHREVQDVLYKLANAAVRAQGGPRPDGGAKAGISASLPGCYVYCEEV